MGARPSRHKSSSCPSCAAKGPAAVPVAPSTSDQNQAQSNRPPAPPHMFQEIIAEENTARDALEEQVRTGGIFLAGKTKKYWVDASNNCFMLFPRGLSITWSSNSGYWSWRRLGEGSDANTEIEEAELKNVCWLEIHGRLELSHLTPGVTYEFVFEVKLRKTAYGWSVPVNLRLKFPDGTIQQHKENLQELPREQWLHLKVGEIKSQKGQNGELVISLFEYGGHWKSGLVIKDIKITPKE